MMLEFIGKTHFKTIQRSGSLGDNQFCAGSGQADTCQGDSGGALLANNIGVRYLNFFCKLR